MRCCNLVSQKAVGFGLKLVHHNPQHSPTSFARPSTCSFHHPKITSGANREAGLSQQLSDPARLGVFNVGLNTLGSAKNCDDTFGGIRHFLTSPVSINDPFAL